MSENFKNKMKQSDNIEKNQSIYTPPKENEEPSKVWEFIKGILILGAIIFVSFFIYCSVQLGEIGH
jgi:hypothetical protein